MEKLVGPAGFPLGGRFRKADIAMSPHPSLIPYSRLLEVGKLNCLRSISWPLYDAFPRVYNRCPSYELHIHLERR